MRDTNDSLSQLLSRTTPKPPVVPTADTVESGDPDAITLAALNGSANGSDAIRPAGRNLTRIHFVDKAGKVRSFQYNHLDAESSYEGGTFRLLFAGVKHWQVTVKGHGPEFWSIYDYITLHRWPCIREATGSRPDVKRDDKETVFTGIEFKDVTPKREE